MCRKSLGKHFVRPAASCLRPGAGAASNCLTRIILGWQVKQGAASLAPLFAESTDPRPVFFRHNRKLRGSYISSKNLLPSREIKVV